MLLAQIIASLVLQIPLPPIPPLPPEPPTPCIPIPITPCLPPSPIDKPPKFPDNPIRIVDRTKTRITVEWKEATDDKGVWKYFLYRDGKYLGSRNPDVRTARFRLLCGIHTYRVDAVDQASQHDTAKLVVKRSCNQGRRRSKKTAGEPVSYIQEVLGSGAFQRA